MVGEFTDKKRDTFAVKRERANVIRFANSEIGDFAVVLVTVKHALDIGTPSP